MVDHLNKINYLESYANPLKDDLVIDIGSNDAIPLKAYNGEFNKARYCPTGKKFKDFYPSKYQRFQMYLI